MKMLFFSKDIYVNQDKRAYFHKETSKNSYIFNGNTAGGNHFKLINEDPNGDIRFYANGGIRLFCHSIKKFSVPATLYIRKGFSGYIARRYEI